LLIFNRIIIQEPFPIASKYQLKEVRSLRRAWRAAQDLLIYRHHSEGARIMDDMSLFPNNL
jgi:hypothetical protein